MGHTAEGTVSFFDLALLEAFKVRDGIFLWVCSMSGARRHEGAFLRGQLSSRMMWTSLTHKWGFLSLGLPVCLLQAQQLFFHLPMFSFDTSELNLSDVSMISDFLFSDQYIIFFHQSSMNVLCPSFHSKTLHSTTSVSRVSTRHPFWTFSDLPCPWWLWQFLRYAGLDFVNIPKFEFVWYPVNL